MTAPTRVVFATGRVASNTLRYRVRMAEELLRSRGIATAAVHSEDPLVASWVDAADLLVVYRAPASRRLLSAVERARSRGVPVTFDVDDLVFLPSMLAHVPFLDDLTPRQRATMQEEARLQELMLGLVDRCTAATTPLVDVLRGVTDVPCQVLPNGVSPIGLRTASAVRPRVGDGRLRLGYFAGSATHDEDWAVVEPALPDLLARHEHVDLVVVGPLRTGPALEPWGHRIHRVRPVAWPLLPQLIADVDVNLAPLAVTPFTEGKSALKWVEAAVVGTPTVATSTTPFREAVDDGVTGVLLAPGEGWLPTLESLVVDADRRHAIARAARDAVLEQFGPQVQADRYEEFVRAALDGPRRDVADGTWEAVRRAAQRSHGLGSLLEDYPFDPGPTELRVPAPAGAGPLDATRRLSRRARASARRARALARRVRR